MATVRDSNEPQGPPPAWLEDFGKDLDAALASADETGPDFDPPDGVPLNDHPEHVQAVFLKKNVAGDWDVQRIASVSMGRRSHYLSFVPVRVGTSLSAARRPNRRISSISLGVRQVGRSTPLVLSCLSALRRQAVLT